MASIWSWEAGVDACSSTRKVSRFTFFPDSCTCSIVREHYLCEIYIYTAALHVRVKYCAAALLVFVCVAESAQSIRVGGQESEKSDASDEEEEAPKTAGHQEGAGKDVAVEHEEELSV